MTATDTAQRDVGAYLDLPYEQYDAINALSNSGMSDLAVSPMRYWYNRINPAPKPEEPEAPALKIGKALHCAVLESAETFDSRYCCDIDLSAYPVCLDTVQEIRAWVTDKGGKCSGTRKEDVIASALMWMEKVNDHVPILEVERRRFYAQNEAKTILHPDEWQRVAGMAQSLLEEPELKPILAKGRSEVSLVARDPETGVPLKARLDWMAPKTTLDLKSFTVTRGKSVDQAVHDAIYYERYYIQYWFYEYVRSLVEQDTHPADFVFAFVESDQPHEVRLRRLTPKNATSANMYWLQARVEVRRLIRLYADCLAKWGDEPWREKQNIARLTDENVKQFAWSTF